MIPDNSTCRLHSVHINQSNTLAFHKYLHRSRLVDIIKITRYNDYKKFTWANWRIIKSRPASDIALKAVPFVAISSKPLTIWKEIESAGQAIEKMVTYVNEVHQEKEKYTTSVHFGVGVDTQNAAVGNVHRWISVDEPINLWLSAAGYSVTIIHVTERGQILKGHFADASDWVKCDWSAPNGWIKAREHRLRVK